MMRILLLMTGFFAFFSVANAQITYSGYVYDAANREALPGATVYHANSGRGVITNSYGFFSLTLRDSTALLRFSYVGFLAQSRAFNHRNSQLISILLDEQNNVMDDVVVTADRSGLKEQVRSTKMGTIGLKPVEVSRIATFGGESDMIKVLQLMPGVTPGHEGQTGMFVRGGTDDQNLILLDEATVYNVAHLLGFFSVFNTDAISDVQLEKGPFPTRYGGRLSSVVDVRMKEGSLSRWQAQGGVGLLTSRLTLEGPLIKDRASFMVSGRRTYVDRVTRAAGAELPYYFYDLNAKLNVRVTPRDRIFVSSYAGEDILAVAADDDPVEPGDTEAALGFTIGNRTITSRWNRVYDGGKLFSNVTIHHTRFKYDIFGRFSDNNLLIRSQIYDTGVKSNFEYFPAPGLQVTAGLDAIHHTFRPNVINTSGDIEDLVEDQAGKKLFATEGAAYVAADAELNDRIRVSAGMRFTGALTGSTLYTGPEPRLSARYTLTENHSLKAGYSLMRQYMHRVSSSSLALPTDLWYPVTEGVRPQRAHQFSVGYYGALPRRDLSFSVEAYAKRMYNLIEYREGARLLLNDNFERELLNGDGRSVGIEFFLRKHTGRLSGWVSYTLARTERQFDELNLGRVYPDRFDRRHNISVVGMAELADNLVFSANWVYLSGSRITVQNGQFLMPSPGLNGVELVPIFTSRNAVQLASTHRLDLNFIVRRPKRSWGRGEWHFSAYNFYNRAAPFQVGLRTNGAGLEYYQAGLFGFLPSIAYNFNFGGSR